MLVALSLRRIVLRKAFVPCAPFRPFSETATVNFVNGSVVTSVAGKCGASLLEVAHKNNIDLEGACGGELACSTCHLILDPEWYERVLKACPKGEEEEDLLDLAWGLTDTSRLGCQIKLSKAINGLVAHIPDEALDPANRSKK